MSTQAPTSTLPFDVHPRVSSAWEWFEHAAPELAEDEASAYLLSLGAAHGHDRSGRGAERDAALDRLRAFVQLVLQPRMREARDATRDAEGLTDLERRDKDDLPLPTAEVAGVPMRAALPSEAAMFALNPPPWPVWGAGDVLERDVADREAEAQRAKGAPVDSGPPTHDQHHADPVPPRG